MAPGAFEVEELEPASGYGYALTLRGAATYWRQDSLAERVAGYQTRLTALRAKVAAP